MSLTGWWPLLMAGLICFGLFWGIWNRAKWDRVWGTNNGKIPEGRWRYDVAVINEFVTRARPLRVGGSAALPFYVRSILRRSDLAFAVGLSAATVWVWAAVIQSSFFWEWLRWAAFPAGAMAIVYGIADLAEDLKLAAILRGGSAQGLIEFDHADVAAANILTRVKIVALFLSIVGAAIFAILVVAQWLITTGLGTGAASGRSTNSQTAERGWEDGGVPA